MFSIWDLNWSKIHTSLEAWTLIESESWARHFLGLDVRVGVDAIEGLEAVAWEYVMGLTLMLIREGIADLTPVGLSDVPLEPGGVWYLCCYLLFPWS